MANSIRLLFYNAESLPDDMVAFGTHDFGVAPDASAAHVAVAWTIPDDLHGVAVQAVVPRIESLPLPAAMQGAGLLEALDVPVPNAEAALTWALAQVGGAYDAGLIVREFAVWLDPAYCPGASDVNFDCSTFALAALVKGGWELPPSLVGKIGWVTPEQLRESVRDVPGVTVFYSAT